MAELAGKFEPLNQAIAKLLVVRLSAVALEPFRQALCGLCEWADVEFHNPVLNCR